MTQIIHRGCPLLFICTMATVLSRILDQIFKVDMSLEGRPTYGWKYTDTEWRLNIAEILSEIVTKINLDVKASIVGTCIWFARIIRI